MIYTVYRCPKCRRWLTSSNSLLGFNIGRPLKTCCGSVFDLRDFDNEWALMAPAEKLGVFIPQLFVAPLLALIIFAVLGEIKVTAILECLIRVADFMNVSISWASYWLSLMISISIIATLDLWAVKRSNSRLRDRDYAKLLRTHLTHRRSYWGGLVKQPLKGKKSLLFSLFDKNYQEAIKLDKERVNEESKRILEMASSMFGKKNG